MSFTLMLLATLTRANDNNDNNDNYHNNAHHDYASKHGIEHSPRHSGGVRLLNYAQDLTMHSNHNNVTGRTYDGGTDRCASIDVGDYRVCVCRPSAVAVSACLVGCVVCVFVCSLCGWPVLLMFALLKGLRLGSCPNHWRPRPPFGKRGTKTLSPKWTCSMTVPTV